MAIWSSSLPVLILSGFCQFMSFCEPLGFYCAYIYLFFLTSKHVSLLSHHSKHQLSTCISKGLFQRLSSHIFSIYVSLSGSFQTFLFVPIYFVSHSLCGLLFMTPCLFISLPCGFIIQIVINLICFINSGVFYIKNDIKYNCNRLSRSLSLLCVKLGFLMIL